MTIRLGLLCHASTSATSSAAFPDDEPLDQVRRHKLANVRHDLRHADRCWTSPALRAIQTSEALRLAAIPEPLLRDCDYGRWTGQSFDAVQADEPEALAEWLRNPAAMPHGGESLLELMQRVANWLDSQTHGTGQVVAVTHASVIRAAVIHALGAPPPSFWRIDIAPLSLTRLTGDPGRWTLASIEPMTTRALTAE